MSANARVVSPFGNRHAAPDTEEYAMRWRVDMYAAVSSLDVQPNLVASLKAVGEKFKLWSLLKDAAGKPFRTFDEFCEAPRPCGLATPATKVRAAIEAVHGKKVVALVTTPPGAPVGAKPGNRNASKSDDGGEGDSEGVARESTGENNSSLSDELNQPATKVAEKTTTKANRAILRAPEAVQSLYKSDLIGQKEAAKLGPKSPTPDEAARVTEIAQKAVEAVKAAPKPTTNAAKRKLQQQVNALVRQELGTPEPAPSEKLVRSFEKVEGDEKVVALVRMVRRLSPEQKAAFVREASPYLPIPAGDE